MGLSKSCTCYIVLVHRKYFDCTTRLGNVNVAEVSRVGYFFNLKTPVTIDVGVGDNKTKELY